MSALQNVITELREKRLWPVAVALVVALIAVPVLLSGGSQPPAPAAAAPVLGTPNVPAVPAVSVTTTPSNARLTGRVRNPFAQQVKASSGTTGSSTGSGTTSGASSGSPGSSSSSGNSSSSGSGSTSGSSGSSGSTTSGTGTTTTPAAPPAPSGLTSTQSYHVAISLTNSAGGVGTIDPVERLSVLPSEKQPLLIELGVLQGGHHVLFIVQPGTVVHGPGTCTPGPIDCQILSLAPNEIEGLSRSSQSGPVSVAQMAVTGIGTDRYSTPATADAARSQESATGRRLLDRSTLTALSLFAYRPGLGAVADLRNLTVGGS